MFLKNCLVPPGVEVSDDDHLEPFLVSAERLDVVGHSHVDRVAPHRADGTSRPRPLSQAKDTA